MLGQVSIWKFLQSNSSFSAPLRAKIPRKDEGDAEKSSFNVI